MVVSLTAPALDLGLPTDWLFKGEGAANVVYDYTGSLPHLVGKVLKVRKCPSWRPSPAQALLENRVWEPVLGSLPNAAAGGADYSAAMARELLYVQRCLVPLLGAEHVPAQEPVSVPADFLRQLSSASAPLRGCARALDSSSPAGLALLMPDVTKLPPVAASAAVAAGPPLTAPAAAGPVLPETEAASAAAAVPSVASAAAAPVAAPEVYSTASAPAATAAADQVELACGSEELSAGEGSDVSSGGGAGVGAEDLNPNVGGDGAASLREGMAGSGAVRSWLSLGLACGSGGRSPFEGCTVGSRGSGGLYPAVKGGGGEAAGLGKCTANAGPALELRAGRGLMWWLEDSAEAISLSPREEPGSAAAGGGADAGGSCDCPAAIAMDAGRADSAAELSSSRAAGGSGGLEGAQHAEQQWQAVQQAQQAQQQHAHQDFSAAGPVLCVEIKPKCGFVGVCSTVHPDNRIKYSRSRYALHQLLKLSEGKVEVPSTYEPTDLFSGDPERMLRALRALLAHPQNNLRVFLGGRPVGVRQGVRAWAEAAAAAAAGDEKGEAGGEAAAVDAPSEGLAGALPEARDSKGEAGGAAAGVGTPREGSAGALPEAGAGGWLGSAGGSAHAVQGTDPQEALLAVLLQVLLVDGVLQQLLAAQQQCPYDIEGVYALYCKLLKDSAAGAAGAYQAPGSSGGSMQREGAQQRQQRGSAAAESGHAGSLRCSCGGRDPACGAAQCDAWARPEAESSGSSENPSPGAAAPAGAAEPAADNPSPSPSSGPSCSHEALGEPVAGGPSPHPSPCHSPGCSHEALAQPATGDPSPRLGLGYEPHCCHETALRRLLALAPCAAHAVLRQYVVSATARDCALMVSLQRLGGGQPPPEGAQGVHCLERAQLGGARHPEGLQCLGGAQLGGGQHVAGAAPRTNVADKDGQQGAGAAPATEIAAQREQQVADAAPPTKLLYCPEAGGWYRYRVAFVDLDMKALAKIPKHYALDQRILAAARDPP